MRVLLLALAVFVGGCQNWAETEDEYVSEETVVACRASARLLCKFHERDFHSTPHLRGCVSGEYQRCIDEEILALFGFEDCE